MSISEIDPDALIWGATQIAKATPIVDAKGRPNPQKAARLLRQGLLDGDKVGPRMWVSTLRRLRKPFIGESTAA